MEKLTSLFKSYFKNRRIPFFIGLGAAALSILSGILYISCLSGLDKDYISAWVCVLPILGGLIFAAFGLFRQAKAGAVALTALDFASLIIFALTVYEYPLEQVMVISNVMDIPYMASIIVVAVFLLICIILSNVLCYLPLGDKEAQMNEEIKGE